MRVRWTKDSPRVRRRARRRRGLGRGGQPINFRLVACCPSPGARTTCLQTSEQSLFVFPAAHISSIRRGWPLCLTWTDPCSRLRDSKTDVAARMVMATGSLLVSTTDKRPGVVSCCICLRRFTVKKTTVRTARLGSVDTGLSKRRGRPSLFPNAGVMLKRVEKIILLHT